MNPKLITIDDRRVLPLGVPRTIGADQPQYIPLPAHVVLARSRPVVTRWEITPNERLLIQNGVDLYLTVMTFGEPFQPVMLTIGPPDLSHAMDL